MRRSGSLFATVFLLLFAASANAHDLPAGSNLAVLGRIWGIVRYAHPSLAYKDIDWDAAGLRAITRVRTSPQSSSTLTAAVDEMLSALNDPATHVTPQCYETGIAPTANRSTRVLAEGVVYVAATTPATAQTASTLRTAKRIIIDLRPESGRCDAPAFANELVPLLFPASAPHASHRKVRHRGYVSQAADVVQQPFSSAFVKLSTGREEATPESSVASVVFIVGERSHIAPFATALAEAGRAAFVSVGTFPLYSALAYCQAGLPDLSTVTIRTSELVDADGYTAEPAATMTLPADASEADVLAAALQTARPRAGRRRATGVHATAPGGYQHRREARYETQLLPSVEERILAAYRLWNVIDFFYADRASLGAWDAELHPIIDALEDAGTRREYELALAEAMAMVPDPQVHVSSSVLVELRGEAAAPFRLTVIDGKPVVARSFTESVKGGDELLRIDGRTLESRIAELQRYSFADVTPHLANGRAGSSAAFTFRRADGSQFDVSLPRGPNAAATPTKAWRIMNGNVALVELSHLSAADVDAMFTDIAATSALILDLRGDVQAAVASAVIARLTEGALVSVTRIPEIVGGSYWYAEVRDVILPSPLARYTRRTVALIDERTRGTAEEALIALQRTDTVFVGGTSAGALGSTSEFVVPGGIQIRFTAADVRDAGYRPVLGVGVEPDRKAAMTVRGLADGRDELLERAIAVASE